MKFKLIEWCGPYSPSKKIPYDHLIGVTPIGKYVISWKSWKEYDYPTVDSTPFERDEFFGAFSSVAIAQLKCQGDFNARIESCIGDESEEEPVETSMWDVPASMVQPVQEGPPRFPTKEMWEVCRNDHEDQYLAIGRAVDTWTKMYDAWVESTK